MIKDPRNPHEIPPAMAEPVELDHDIIEAAFEQIGQEAHRHARASGFWYGLDAKKPADLWLKISLIAEELGELARALREGRLRTTMRPASAKEIEQLGIREVEVEGAEDEGGDVVLRLADAFYAAGFNLGRAVLRKIEKNRRRPFGHGGRTF